MNVEQSTITRVACDHVGLRGDCGSKAQGEGAGFLVTGAGRGFCSGLDLKDAAAEMHEELRAQRG